MSRGGVDLTMGDFAPLCGVTSKTTVFSLWAEPWLLGQRCPPVPEGRQRKVTADDYVLGRAALSSSIVRCPSSTVIRPKKRTAKRPEGNHGRQLRATSTAPVPGDQSFRLSALGPGGVDGARLQVDTRGANGYSFHRWGTARHLSLVLSKPRLSPPSFLHP